MAFVKSIRQNLASNKAAFKQTSSLNKYFLCHYCNRKYISKNVLRKHVFDCVATRTCKWCKIEFKNSGNLAVHSLYIHNDKDIKLKTLEHACPACERTFSNGTTLKLHMRREHYNLIMKIPVCQNKKLNETWYEKVINSDSIVEIKKVTCNLLLIKKYDGDSIDVEECNDTIDLTEFYTTGKRIKKVSCDICEKKILARAFKKHYEERHGNVQKHHCNNCNKTFKRSYFFIQHQCNKEKKRRRVNLEISKVESLAVIPV